MLYLLYLLLYLCSHLCYSGAYICYSVNTSVLHSDVQGVGDAPPSPEGFSVSVVNGD